MSKIKTNAKLLLGRWRLWWNLCPVCNSDAPDVYDCPVCEGFQFSDYGRSPDEIDKAIWWTNFTKRLRNGGST